MFMNDPLNVHESLVSRTILLANFIIFIAPIRCCSFPLGVTTFIIPICKVVKFLVPEMLLVIIYVCPDCQTILEVMSV